MPFGLHGAEMLVFTTSSHGSQLLYHRRCCLSSKLVWFAVLVTLISDKHLTPSLPLNPLCRVSTSQVSTRAQRPADKRKKETAHPAGIYHAAGNWIQTGHGKVKAKVKPGPRTAVLDSRRKTGFLSPFILFAAECGATEDNGALLAWKNPRRGPVGPCLEPVSPPPPPLARRFA